MSELPLILFVPGLRPKPEPERHKAELLRCLAEGVRRTDSAVAADLQAHAGCLEVIAWTFPFYGVHHDIELDIPGIDALIETKGASPRDRADAESWATFAKLHSSATSASQPSVLPSGSWKTNWG